MITIGTARFDIRTVNESFARTLNGRWNAFFQTSFEAVVEEVLSAFDPSDQLIEINHLPLDLGDIEEEEFYKQFPLRLREALNKYWLENIVHRSSEDVTGRGIRIISTGQSAFELLSFFLLHGYFPANTDVGSQDLNQLLSTVVSEEAYRFKEFLNAYGHYDFLCQRLVFQFSDEQLEEIVRVVQPSESIFINLYVRVQIRAHAVMNQSDITRDEYRNAVWTLVLAYLFAESGGSINRKQLIIHTLRELAAHLNCSFAEMTRLLTESIQQLEYAVGQLPELWSILRDIRLSVQDSLWTLEGDYYACLLREVVSVLRTDRTKDEATIILSQEHLYRIFGNTDYRRKLLQRLHEREIHRLVIVLIPAESGYIISYAGLLDKHRDAGTFTGKAGNEFRLLKWEFIFAVLTSMAVSAFNRRQFVLSVLQQLAAHYNLSVSDLIHWLYADKELSSSLHDLYEEHLLPMVQTAAVRSWSDGELEHWIVSLLGTHALSADVQDIYIERWIRFLLEERNDLFRALWKAGRLNEALVLRWAGRTPALRSLWLRRIGDGRLLNIYRRFTSIYAELRAGLKEYSILEAQAGFLSIWMVELTARKYLAWSEKEIIGFLIARVHQSAPYSIRVLIEKMSIMGQNEDYSEAIRRLHQKEDELPANVGVDVSNAGVMLISPYLPMLFCRSGFLTDNHREFKSTDDGIHAIFLIQYLLYGEQREWKESELYLNKIMVGLEAYNQPLPRNWALSQEDETMAESLINSICCNWDKMKNTSIRGFREAFLQRRGRVILSDDSGRWEVKVEEKVYDVLIDSLPWGYKMCKYPWQQKVIEVKWR